MQREAHNQQLRAEAGGLRYSTVRLRSKLVVFWRYTDIDEVEKAQALWAVVGLSRFVLLPASQILQDSVNLFFFAKSLKERQQVQELCVIHVVKPGLDGNLRRQSTPQDYFKNRQDESFFFFSLYLYKHFCWRKCKLHELFCYCVQYTDRQINRWWIDR